MSVSKKIKLPECVEDVIREYYPSNHYVGFHSNANDIQGNYILAINDDREIMTNRFWVKDGKEWLLKDGNSVIIICHCVEEV